MINKVDILIKNGLVYDGTISEPYISDIAISRNKIQFIDNPNIKDVKTIIDAKGLSVCPGFIDTHAHSDFTIIADPRAEGKLFQGITTEINGNCGMSAAPLYNKTLERRETDLKEYNIKKRWNNFKEYFDIVEKNGTAINFATLVGHGNIRGSVIGYEDRTPSKKEFSKMCSLLGEAIEQGAIGFSTGLIYPPGIFSTTEELVALSKLLKVRGLIFTSHMRSEGTMLIEAVQEIIRIGKETGLKIHISHIKTAGEENWHKADNVISLLKNAIHSGIKLTCDRYPYTASSTDLDSLLPSWVFTGGNDEEINRLLNRNNRVRIKKELKNTTKSNDYWKKVIISSVVSEKNRWMEGKSIRSISNMLKISGIDFIFKLLIEERLRVGAIFKSMTEVNLIKFLSLPFCMIGSDSSSRSFNGITMKGKPHPRGFGTFPRFLGKYVRQKKLMPLSSAIHKSTMLPAKTFRLKGRGQIKKGMYADIVIFDSNKIEDSATFSNPFQKPKGIYYVLVNGVPAIWEEKPTGNLSGRILRNHPDNIYSLKCG